MMISVNYCKFNEIHAKNQKINEVNNVLQTNSLRYAKSLSMKLCTFGANVP